MTLQCFCEITLIVSAKMPTAFVEGQDNNLVNQKGGNYLQWRQWKLFPLSHLTVGNVFFRVESIWCLQEVS